MKLISLKRFLTLNLLGIALMSGALHAQEPAEPSAELETLSSALQTLRDKTAEVEQQQQTRQRQFTKLRDGLETYRKLINLGNLEGEFAQMFLQSLRQLPEQNTLENRLTALSEEIATTRRQLYLLQDTKIVIEETETEEELTSELNKIEKKISETKSKLEAGYTRLISLLTELESTERNYAQKVSEFRDFATEKLFWVRSSPPISAESLRSIPAGLRYCFGPGNLAKSFNTLSKTPLIYYLVTGAALLALVLGRRKYRNILIESGQAYRKISTNRFANTLRALAMTLLLALPLPFFTLTLALAIGWHHDLDKWSTGLRDGLVHATSYIFLISMVISTCRTNGLAQLHFSWTEKQIKRTRKTALASLIIYIPTVITLGFILTEGSSQYLNGVGRFATLIMILGLGLMLANLLHPSHGLIAQIHATNPESQIGKTRKVWAPLIYLITAIICTLSLAGYILTSVMLIVQFGFVIAAVLGVILIHSLCIRWLSIHERRFAFERALAEREIKYKKAQEETTNPDTQPENNHGNEAWIQEIEEKNAMSASLVSEQSRRLLRFVMGVTLLWALYYIWTGFAPVTRSLDGLTLFGNLTFGDILLVAVVLTLTISAVRNLPGLLEGIFLSRLKLTSGGRHTAITLIQYAVVGIGASVLFQNLGIDWSKFAWIAAALSVGIGFGLQEVVANFISGVILLFERPIRVGDVVTVDGIDGVVSKIQIRATTITGWDRKEFIVPNKNFVTGTLLNWTLSNPVNRVFIQVGVAYGSDTELARELLVKTASEHPNILEDPAPVASFVAFGNSTLDLELRAYLPDMSNRLGTISELHTAIDKNFKEANIEIAFPQLDLHLRSKV